MSAIVWNILRDCMSPEDCEETASDVFLAAWEQAPDLRPGHVKGWLGAVARNKAKNKLRQRNQTLPLMEDILDLPGPDDPAGALERAEEQALSTGQIETLDQIGRTFEESAVTSNGATITPIAAVASESTLYIRLRIEAPEGVTLPDRDSDEAGYYQLDGPQWPEEHMLLTFEVGDDVKGYCCDLEWQPDDDPTDNVKEVVIRYISAGIEPAQFNDGTAKFLTIRGLWIQSSQNEYTPVFTGKFVFEVGSRLQSEDVHIDCGGVSHRVTDGYVNYLDTITLSPIDISYSFRTTLRSDNALGMFPAAPGELCVVMKDGTKHYVYDYMESNNPHQPTPGFDPDTMIADGPYGYLDSPYWPITEQFPFAEPLDLSQVDHILFDETYVFPVNPD